MASPQLKNGYVAIATELFEAMIRFRVPGELEQVLKAVVRKTYGFNKKEDRIANSQIVLLTGLDRRNVSRAMTRLVEHKLVIRTDDKNGKGSVTFINKNYDEWVPFIVIKADDTLSSKLTTSKVKKLSSRRRHLSSELTTPVIRTDDKVSSELTDTITNNHIITTIQKPVVENTTTASPEIETKNFFKGIQDLRKSQEEGKAVESGEGLEAKNFLHEIQKKYPDAPKALMWEEIKKFERYWTEKNGTGTKQLWQMQKTFEVPRRLVTWFGRVKNFNQVKKVETKNVTYQAGKVILKKKA